MTVAEAVTAALAAGIERVVFTEHTEAHFHPTAGWFDDYVRDINRLREEKGDDIDILVGLEAPATDYKQGLEMPAAAEDRLDFLLGAAHRYPDIGDRRVRDLPADEAIDFEYRTLMALAENPRIDAIAHIGATCSKYCGPFPLELARDVVRRAASNNIAIEINPAYHRPLGDVLELCRQENARIVLGSNAHSATEIGRARTALQEYSGK
jgi:histidinol phosphatase-like PHP family hydrolase